MSESIQEILKPKKRRSGLIRWGYVLPRLAILLIIGLATRFGLDSGLHWALVTGGESATGAKVELAELKTSLLDGQVTLKELALANPQSPMKNLVETGDSQLVLDMHQLLRGRVVVTGGTVSGLQFDTDRETSGALDEVVSEEEPGPSIFDPLLGSASEMGEQWFDEIADRFDTNIADQLQSPKLAKELQERWPDQYRQLQAQVKSIRTRGKQLKKSIRDVKANPLRGLEKLVDLQKELVSLQEEVKTVQQQIGNLPKQAEADRQAVLAAREQDEALLREKLKLGTLDGEGLTQTLLGQPVSEGLASALEWVRWAREQVPSNPAKEKASRSRGTTVVFTPPQADFVVEVLQLEGLAQLNGQPLTLTGTLKNASNAPKLLAEPTTLELVGSGALEAQMDIALDRRTDTARDTLHLLCPQLTMTERTLGKADKMTIAMAEGIAHMRVELSLIDDKLSGEILFEQEELQLTPHLAKSPNGQLARSLEQALAGVQRLQANVTLDGTLKKPKLKIDSDIGSQVAAGLNATVKRVLEEQTEGLLAKSRAQVDAQLAKISQLQEKAQSELMGQLGEGQELLTQLASLTGGGNGSSLPGGIPQIGKQLRLGDILKK